MDPPPARPLDRSAFGVRRLVGLQGGLQRGEGHLPTELRLVAKGRGWV